MEVFVDMPVDIYAHGQPSAPWKATEVSAHIPADGCLWKGCEGTRGVMVQEMWGCYGHACGRPQKCLQKATEVSSDMPAEGHGMDETYPLMATDIPVEVSMDKAMEVFAEGMWGVQGMWGVWGYMGCKGTRGVMGTRLV